MTTQVSEILIYNSQEYRMDNAPLEAFFKVGGNRVPFLVRATYCWRGYVGTWSLVDGRLRLDSLDGYIAKGPLVGIADGAFRHQIDYEDQALCSKAALEDIFPDAQGPVFAHWFSGEINAPLLRTLRTT
jgi:hypothetical protein